MLIVKRLPTKKMIGSIVLSSMFVKSIGFRIIFIERIVNINIDLYPVSIIIWFGFKNKVKKGVK